MRKVFLAGAPNVGKSVLFSRLTGMFVVSSNYPGTTVEFTTGRMRLGSETIEVIDVPGTYSLDYSSPAEEVAVRMLDECAEHDIVINVLDATNLERSLNLTLQLAKRGKPMIVALNFWDETKHTGIEINVARLEAMLGVPCVPLVAITGVGVKSLVEKMASARVPSLQFDDARRWDEVGRIVGETQKVTHRHHTLLERLGDASLRPVSGVLIAAVVLFLSFGAVRLIGEGLISYILQPIFEHLWAPVVMSLSGMLHGGGFLHQLLIGSLRDGRVNFTDSFGLLTTGLYVPLAAVLPYVFAFYLVLSFVEDTGYLPRLAVIMDRVMHRVGLHGMGIIPLLLGLGCNVPGIMATRIMESKRERFIAITLIAICTPCMAKTSMIAGLAGRFGAAALLPIFLTLAAVWLIVGTVLGRLLKGESQELLVDIPPYRIPFLRALAKKLWMRMLSFLKEAVPWVLAGVLLVNVLHITGVFDFISKLAAPVMSTLLGLSGDTVASLLVGFMRKDVAVGMLMPLQLDLRQTVVSCVVLATYFPCVATYAVMLRELGFRDTLKAVGIMVGVSIAVGWTLNMAITIVYGLVG